MLLDPVEFTPERPLVIVPGKDSLVEALNSLEMFDNDRMQRDAARRPPLLSSAQVIAAAAARSKSCRFNARISPIDYDWTSIERFEILMDPRRGTSIALKQIALVPEPSSLGGFLIAIGLDLSLRRQVRHDDSAGLSMAKEL